MDITNISNVSEIVVDSSFGVARAARIISFKLPPNSTSPFKYLIELRYLKDTGRLMYILYQGPAFMSIADKHDSNVCRIFGSISAVPYWMKPAYDKLYEELKTHIP